MLCVFTFLFHFIHIHTLVTVGECHIEIKGYLLNINIRSEHEHCTLDNNLDELLYVLLLKNNHNIITQLNIS